MEYPHYLRSSTSIIRVRSSWYRISFTILCLYERLCTLAIGNDVMIFLFIYAIVVLAKYIQDSKKSYYNVSTNRAMKPQLGVQVNFSGSINATLRWAAIGLIDFVSRL